MLITNGIKAPEVSLHSLRHSMAVALERARVHPSVRNRLLGHAVGTDVESKVYLDSLSYNPRELSEALEMVRFPMLTP
jgi:integrase